MGFLLFVILGKREGSRRQEMGHLLAWRRRRVLNGKDKLQRGVGKGRWV